MVRPRLRALPAGPKTSSSGTKSGTRGEPPPAASGRPRRPKRGRERLTVTLDVLGLHRRRREVVRAIGEHVEQLGNLVAMLDMVAADTYSDDPGDELRASSTMMRAASREMMSVVTDLAARLGELRFMAAIEGFTIEEGPPDL